VEVQGSDATAVEALTVEGTLLCSVLCADCARVLKAGKYPGVTMRADGRLEAIPSVPANDCDKLGEHGCGVHCGPCDFDAGNQADCPYHQDNVHARASEGDVLVVTEAEWNRAVALRERLAAYAHEAWAMWMRHLSMRQRGTSWRGEREIWEFEVEDAKRWDRQVRTTYAELPEAEKASDRAQADRILAILRGADTTVAKEEAVPLAERPCMFEGCRTRTHRVDRGYCPACKARMKAREAILRGEG
jgi:hypothetical protein